MLYNATEIAMLLQKHVKNELSAEERKRLDEWVNASEVNKRTFAELTQEEPLNAAFTEYSTLVYEHRAERSLPDTQKVVRMYAARPSRRIYIGVAASVAAAIIILLGSGAFYFNSRNPKSKEAAGTTAPAQLAYEIPPAGNKATLTLSGGQRIVLSDVGNGRVAQDGKTVISKRQDGELMYNASSSPAGTSSAYNTVTTPRGGKYQVVLPDGSKVWLNAATALRFPIAFTGKDRIVELAGEAYFEVQKDKTKPFKVVMAESGNTPSRQLIEVLGTHFNVGAYPDEPQINATLLEGSIRLTSYKTSTLLQPGQQALMNKATSDIKVIHPDDPQNNIAWVNGKFAFVKTPVGTVMRELSRWYDIQVVYEGNATPTTLFTGEVDRMIPLTKLLSYLEKMGSTRFTIDGKTVKVKA